MQLAIRVRLPSSGTTLNLHLERSALGADLRAAIAAATTDYTPQHGLWLLRTTGGGAERFEDDTPLRHQHAPPDDGPIHVSIVVETSHNQRECWPYLAVLQWNPTDAAAYHNLANTLSGDATVTLNDGRVMGKQALYLEAIKLNPTFANPYNGLANTLSGDATVTLPDGRVMGQQALLQEFRRLG